jgi:hypothetical protein
MIGTRFISLPSPRFLLLHLDLLNNFSRHYRPHIVARALIWILDCSGLLLPLSLDEYSRAFV